MTSTEPTRTSSLGEEHPPSIVFRGRFALITRSIRRAVGSFEGKRIADIGCGYHAPWTVPLLPEVASAVCVDVSLADEVKQNPKIRGVEGVLPDALVGLPAGEVEVIMLISCLEHLTEPLETLTHCRRLLAPGGVLIVNVPTWLGKRVLEFLAFRLGLSLGDEIDDHRMYYNSRDLWPLLRQAGFQPHNISLRPYPWRTGLTTFGVCRA